MSHILYGYTVLAMSTGFQPPPPPMPKYVVSDEWVCRTCSRLVITMVQEYPHPRMRLDCKLGRVCPVATCEEWEREIGVE